MKQETVANKLAALLGITDKVAIPEKFKEKPKNTNRPIPVNMDEIELDRDTQGLIYFLQAPELFTPRTCKHCGEPFFVSRKNISLCSNTCIEKELQAYGLQWTKKNDYAETHDDPFVPMVNDPHIFGGNEPLFVRNLDNLRKALEVLINASESKSNTSEPISSSV